MSLREAIEVVTKLAQRRVIRNYAVAGAVAALNYIDPFLTEDLDILISVDGFERHASGLLLLAPIEKALAELGYTERTGLGYRIGDWPVQFLPAASPLDEEALDQAVEIDLARQGEAPLKVRCLSAEHVVAVAVKLGRPKDFARIQAFLGQDAVDLDRLKSLLARHKLDVAWSEFCFRTRTRNPL